MCVYSFPCLRNKRGNITTTSWNPITVLSQGYPWSGAMLELLEPSRYLTGYGRRSRRPLSRGPCLPFNPSACQALRSVGIQGWSLGPSDVLCFVNVLPSVRNGISSLSIPRCFQNLCICANDRQWDFEIVFLSSPQLETQASQSQPSAPNPLPPKISHYVQNAEVWHGTLPLIMIRCAVT